jgi:hypothetical protein
MTPQNMARHRNSPHMSFWKMLKVGYDHFEVTRQEPKVDVCERRYVFNTESDGRYQPTGRCPAMTVPEDLQAAVRDKQRRDDAEVAELVRNGTRLASVHSFADGSMHPSFLSAVRPHQVDETGVVIARIHAPNGTIPANIRIPSDRGPPRTAARASSPATTGSISEPVVRVPATSNETRVANAPSSNGSSGGGGSFFGSLFSGGGKSWGGMMDNMRRMVGLGDASSQQQRPAPAPKAKPAKTRRARSAPEHKSVPEKKTAAKQNPGAIRPASQPTTQETAAAPAPVATTSLLKGAQPTAPAGSFDNRFGAWR